MTDLAGRYAYVRSIGRGAMGEVWLADDTVLGRRVAIKRLVRKDGAPLDPELVERLQREARMAARLTHPRIVAVHDLVVVDGAPYVVMEYVRGEPLSDRITKGGSLPLREAARLCAQVASGLARAHASGIVHRDIKPANILIDEDGDAKLGDFGIARAQDDPSLTGTGNMIGTVAYMAPEVARTGAAGPASDIWSLGASLFAAIEGRAPFDDGSHPGSTQVLARLLSEPAPVPQHAGALENLLAHMLAVDPAGRPDAAAVARHLGAAAGESFAANAAGGFGATRPRDDHPFPRPSYEMDDVPIPATVARDAPQPEADATRRRPLPAAPTPVPELPAPEAAEPRASRTRFMILGGVAASAILAAGIAVALASGSADPASSPSPTSSALAKSTQVTSTSPSSARSTTPSNAQTGDTSDPVAERFGVDGTVHTDPYGDASGRAHLDIVRTVVGMERGAVVISVRFAVRISDNEALLVYLDTDGKLSTGCQINHVIGWELRLEAPADAGPGAFAPCVDGGPGKAQSLGTIGGTVVASGRYLRVAIPAARIPNLRALRVAVASTIPTESGGTAYIDFAPGNDESGYAITPSTTASSP